MKPSQYLCYARRAEYRSFKDEENRGCSIFKVCVKALPRQGILGKPHDIAVNDIRELDPPHLSLGLSGQHEIIGNMPLLPAGQVQRHWP